MHIVYVSVYVHVYVDVRVHVYVYVQRACLSCRLLSPS